ncbi:hypothetical protein [Lactobacillus melliventris]|uniref:Uncharacterized protein n=1 Tax=Lactobacillus melliventris TaxID=1218507 RepID=A0ABX5N339_9LACO|nr:hypothetical protein [Lactobacillus melliventris]PXY86176.1 hypothetical protein DK873_01110 [Lactobacillus melliventris]
MNKKSISIWIKSSEKFLEDIFHKYIDSNFSNFIEDITGYVSKYIYDINNIRQNIKHFTSWKISKKIKNTISEFNKYNMLIIIFGLSLSIIILYIFKNNFSYFFAMLLNIILSMLFMNISSSSTRFFEITVFTIFLFIVFTCKYMYKIRFCLSVSYGAVVCIYYIYYKKANKLQKLSRMFGILFILFLFIARTLFVDKFTNIKQLLSVAIIGLFWILFFSSSISCYIAYKVSRVSEFKEKNNKLKKQPKDFQLLILLKSFNLFKSFEELDCLKHLYILDEIITILFLILGINFFNSFFENIIPFILMNFVCCVPIWVNFIYRCREIIISKKKDKKVSSRFFTKAIRSVLVAVVAILVIIASVNKDISGINYNGCTNIELLNSEDFGKDLLLAISYIISALASSVYPILDIYEYTREVIDENDKIR